MLVIGGGVAGLCTALYLAREGADVLVVERDEAGMAASTANAGSLHVQLLSYDFDGETPTAARRSTRLPLGPRRIALWQEIAAEAGEDLGIRTEGGLMLVETAAEFAWARAKVAMERARGIESHLLGANELRRSRPIWPAFHRRRILPRRGPDRPAARHMRCAAWPRGPAPGCGEGVEVQAIARDGAGFAVTTAAARSAPGGW